MTQVAIYYEDKSYESATQPWMLVDEDGNEIGRFSTHARASRHAICKGWEIVDLETFNTQEAVGSDIISTAQVLDIEVDATADRDFGKLYRVWDSYKLLGTFYQSMAGHWVAQPTRGAGQKVKASEDAINYISFYHAVESLPM